MIFYAHRRSFFVDAWWQMHCVVDLQNPPRFVIEPATANDPFYRFVERTWMLQQLPWAILFYVAGGLPWIICGHCTGRFCRFKLTLDEGTWLVGHFAPSRFLCRHQVKSCKFGPVDKLPLARYNA